MMNFIEFIGFIAMLLFMVNAVRDAKKRRENPEEFEEEEREQAERLKAFLRGVNEDMQETPRPRQQKQPLKIHQKTPAPSFQHTAAAPPKPVVRHDHKEHMHTIYEDAYATYEKDPYAHSVVDAYGPMKKKISRADVLMRRLRDPKDMVLWREIIGPPIALKKDVH